MSSTKYFDIVELEDLDYGKKYGLKLHLPTNIGWIDDVELVIDDDYEKYSFPLKHYNNKNGEAIFIGEASLPTRALHHYYFKYRVGNETRFIKSDSITDTYINRDEMQKISVNYKVPEWTKGAMMYHIFVDRFYRGSNEPMQEMPRRIIHQSIEEDVITGPDKDGIWNNDFYGGDLKGITEKLDYIESLGIDIIYLSPIVYSQSTHRYDASDYEQVDPYAGNLEDLKELCEEAHKRGMKVVLDAVFNHTGSDSKYYNYYRNPEWEQVAGKGAYWDENSKYSRFFRKHYNPSTGKMDFDYWFGFETLPVCNGDDKAWQDYITGENGIIDKWYACGIDGLRLDVADELTDYFIELIRIASERNKKDSFILGEVWYNPMTQKKDNMLRGYLRDGDKMHSVMGYNFVDPVIRYLRYGDDRYLDYKIREIKTTYPDDAIFANMNFTSTHDITRGINLWDPNLFSCREWPWNLYNEDHEWGKKYHLNGEEYEKAKEIYKAYVYTLAFMPGILSIFYADEVGLQGIGNLNNRRPYPWGKEDQDLLAFFRSIGQIRKNEPFLRTADLKIVDLNPEILMFERTNDQGSSIITINRTPEEKKILLPKEYEKEQKVYTLKRATKKELPAYGAIAVKKD